MKRFFIAAAATCLSLSCLAQESNPVEYKGWGIAAGAVYNYPLGRNFYIEPGASLFYDTYEYDDLILSTGEMTISVGYDF